MSLTKNGQRIGAAQHTHLKEERQWREEKWSQYIDGLKKQYADALGALMILDPTGWEQWYDNDSNVPEFHGSWENCIPALTAIHARVKELLEKATNEEEEKARRSLYQPASGTWAGMNEVTRM